MLVNHIHSCLIHLLFGVCCAINKETGMRFKWAELNVELWASPWFQVCHTELCVWGPTDTKLEKQSLQM
jgi:hypothetical protein